MSSEHLGYFLRYFLPTGLGLAAAVGVAYLTKWLPSILGKPSLADPIELFAFSVVVSGPFVFAATFVTSFFAIARLGGDNAWARSPLMLSLLILGVVLFSHFLLLPRR